MVDLSRSEQGPSIPVLFTLPGRGQPLPAEALGKSLRVFRLGETEHNEVAVVAVSGVRVLRRR
jgi:hypothetical protein